MTQVRPTYFDNLTTAISMLLMSRRLHLVAWWLGSLITLVMLCGLSCSLSLAFS